MDICANVLGDSHCFFSGSRANRLYVDPPVTYQTIRSAATLVMYQDAKTERHFIDTNQRFLVI